MSAQIDEARQAHRVGYENIHGTLVGEDDAWTWWRDPTLKCYIVLAGRSDAERCRRVCESCILWSRTNVQRP